MKYIRKIFHPLVPFLILLLILFKMTYDNFSKLEDYTEEETKILIANSELLKDLKKLYASDYIHYSRYFPITHRYYSNYNIEEIDSLNKIYKSYSEFLRKEGEVYVNNNSTVFSSGYRMNGKIKDLIEDYVTKIKDIDSTLFLYYKDYKFNNAISESEIQRLYVSKNDQELFYILDLFEAEMDKIYYDAVVVFMYQKIYFPESEYICKNTKLVPILNTDSSFLRVESRMFFAFDTINDKIRMPKNIDYYFSKDGYYIVSKQYEKDSIIQIEINSQQVNRYDTILYE